MRLVLLFVCQIVLLSCDSKSHDSGRSFEPGVYSIDIVSSMDEEYGNGACYDSSGRVSLRLGKIKSHDFESDNGIISHIQLLSTQGQKGIFQSGYVDENNEFISQSSKLLDSDKFFIHENGFDAPPLTAPVDPIIFTGSLLVGGVWSSGDSCLGGWKINFDNPIKE